MGWGYAFAALFGVAIFFFASRGEAKRYLESPWMRGRDWRYRQRQEEQAGAAKAVKDDLSWRIGIGLDGDRETAALSRAILLGERRRLPRRTKQLFVESGTMHVFAISGLHVMAIAKVLAVALGLFMIPLRLAGLLSVPLLWLSGGKGQRLLTYLRTSPIWNCGGADTMSVWANNIRGAAVLGV